MILICAVGMLFTVGANSEAIAEQCGKNVNYGFGLFKQSNLICSSKKFDGQRCYYASAKSQSHSFSVSFCRLDSNYEWVGRKERYDFKVKDGWSKYKIRLRNTKCFEFERMTGSNFQIGEFCDQNKQSHFSEAEIETLIKSRKNFGNLVPISNSETVKLPDKIPENFNQLRRVTFQLSNGEVKTMGAGRVKASNEGFSTDGLVILNGYLCSTSANFVNGTKEGSFEIICPDGFSMSGGYIPLGKGSGSIGRGYDNNQQPVEYRLHSNLGSNFVSVTEFTEFYEENIYKTSSTSKTDKAKLACIELGFTPKTEKFADCVIKLM